MSVLRIIFVVLFTTLSGSVLSQDNWDFFAGKWDFEIRFKGHTGTKPDLKATWTMRKCLKKTVCLCGSVTLDGQEFSNEQITYHPGQKEYIRTIITNNGDYLVFTSSGWGVTSLRG